MSGKSKKKMSKQIDDLGDVIATMQQRLECVSVNCTELRHENKILREAIVAGMKAMLAVLDEGYEEENNATPKTGMSTIMNMWKQPCSDVPPQTDTEPYPECTEVEDDAYDVADSAVLAEIVKPPVSSGSKRHCVAIGVLNQEKGVHIVAWVTRVTDRPTVSAVFSYGQNYPNVDDFKQTVRNAAVQLQSQPEYLREYNDETRQFLIQKEKEPACYYDMIEDVFYITWQPKTSSAAPNVGVLDIQKSADTPTVSKVSDTVAPAAEGTLTDASQIYYHAVLVTTADGTIKTVAVLQSFVQAGVQRVIGHRLVHFGPSRCPAKYLSKICDVYRTYMTRHEPYIYVYPGVYSTLRDMDGHIRNLQLRGADILDDSMDNGSPMYVVTQFELDPATGAITERDPVTGAATVYNE